MIGYNKWLPDGMIDEELRAIRALEIADRALKEIELTEKRVRARSFDAFLFVRAHRTRIVRKHWRLQIMKTYANILHTLSH